MKTRLTHIRINVSDIQASLKWYKEVIGFETNGEGWPLDNPKYYDFCIAEGAAFAIMEVAGEKSYGRLNFVVGDEIDAMWERLKDKVTIIGPIFNTPWGTRKFTIADPDGNELGFVNETEPF